MGLGPTSLEALRKVNYHTPSPIQAAFIPLAVTGGDCTGQARTGTGKTAAFGLPILERIDPNDDAVQALIMTPTRELSEQVAAEIRRLSSNLPVKVLACVGGKDLRRQIDALRQGAHIVVGTPGRVIDLMGRENLNLDKLKVVVLDEADRMLDIGFRPDIEKILRRCPTERQTMLLSATMPPPVERLAQKYMRNAQRVDLSGDAVVTDSVKQYYVPVEHKDKLKVLVRLLVKERPNQVIVFTRTKRGADLLYKKLSVRLPHIAHMHGDLPQSARDRALKMFRERKIRMLIATDVVGRGIDISSVSHIINYDIPEFCDDYVHRVGRTGRLSGERGHAFTLVCKDEGDQLTSIEKRINYLLPKYDLDSRQNSREIQAELVPVVV